MCSPVTRRGHGSGSSLSPPALNLQSPVPRAGGAGLPEAKTSLSFRRDPNDPRDPKVPQWPPYTAGAQQYVSLNLRPLEVRRGLRAQACAFWNRFLPKLLSATGMQGPAGRGWVEEGKKGARRERGEWEPAGRNPSLLPPPASKAPSTCSGPAHGEAAPRPRPGLPLPLLLLLFLHLSRLLRL